MPRNDNGPPVEIDALDRITREYERMEARADRHRRMHEFGSTPRDWLETVNPVTAARADDYEVLSVALGCRTFGLDVMEMLDIVGLIDQYKAMTADSERWQLARKAWLVERQRKREQDGRAV